MRWLIAVAWLGLCSWGLLALYGLSGLVLMLIAFSAAPVFAAAVCYGLLRSSLAVIIDASALVYMAWMVWGYENGYGTGDALAALVFLFYPLCALVIIAFEMAVIRIIRGLGPRKHRGADE